MVCLILSSIRVFIKNGLRDIERDSLYFIDIALDPFQSVKYGRALLPIFDILHDLEVRLLDSIYSSELSSSQARDDPYRKTRNIQVLRRDFEEMKAIAENGIRPWVSVDL